MQNGFDFRITPNNDLAKNAMGSLLSTTPYLYQEQQIRLRLQTQAEDWATDKYFAANLDELRGQDINEELLEEIRLRTLFALTHDGLFMEEELQVETLWDGQYVVTIELRIPKWERSFQFNIHTLYGMELR